MVIIGSNLSGWKEWKDKSGTIMSIKGVLYP